MSADNGNIFAGLPIGAGVDATAFNDGDAFTSCRDGTLTVVRETTPDKFEVVETVKTPTGREPWVSIRRPKGCIYPQRSLILQRLVKRDHLQNPARSWSWS